VCRTKLCPPPIHASDGLDLRCHSVEAAKAPFRRTFQLSARRLRVLPQRPTLNRDPHCIRGAGSYFLVKARLGSAPSPDTPAVRPDKPDLRQQLPNPKRFSLGVLLCLASADTERAPMRGSLAKALVLREVTKQACRNCEFRDGKAGTNNFADRKPYPLDFAFSRRKPCLEGRCAGFRGRQHGGR
jgi:hypothetical protein